MSTTVVRDSIVGDAWIQQTATAVPMQYVVDQETGQQTTDFLTGPVRLAFDTLFTLPPPSAGNENPKYGAALLFTPYADFGLMHVEYNRVCAEEFQSNYDAGTQQYLGLHSPFRDQGEKAKFGGFTPGCTFITVSSKYKPPVVDSMGNPIVDPSKVYPGVWAICGLNAYSYGISPPQPKKGVNFGLQSVMIIGDDKSFGGAAPDTNKIYSGIKGQITAPTVTPQQLAAAAGTMAGAPAPAPAAVPGPPPGGTYAQMPQAATPSAPTGVVQMPGQPVPAATGAVDPRGPVPPGFGSWAEYDELMG